MENEKGAIACLLLDPELNLTTRLRDEHFTNDLFRKCFEVIKEYPGEVVEIAVLANKVGTSYDDIYSISSFVFTSSGYEQYEQSIIDDYIYRQYLLLSDKIYKIADNKEGINKVQNLIVDMGNVGVEKIEEKKLISGSIETIIQLSSGQVNPVICNYGYVTLDSYLKGYRKGSLITVGARTGVGKSTFALNLLSKALDQGIECCLFSTEMSQQEINIRYIAHKSGYTQYQMENMTADISDDIIEKMGNLDLGAECTIFDNFGDYQNLCNLIRKKAIQGTKLFFVDYLQNITNNTKFQLKTHIIGEMSTGLKKLALELGVSIIQMAQLNRESSKDLLKIPRKEHLRESGDIEQDSDVILLLHDESKYDASANENRLTIIIAKNRHGKEFSFDMGIVRKYFTIYDL